MKALRSMLFAGAALLLFSPAQAGESKEQLWQSIERFFSPPPEYQNDNGKYKSPLLFTDGHKASSPAEWSKRRQEILNDWTGLMGHWPPLLQNSKVEILSKTNRENFVQYKIRIEVSPNQMEPGYLLVPTNGTAKMPAVIVPFYDAETSIGLGKQPLHAFGSDLAKRGFVALAIGSPGGDARDPKTGEALCQPLSFLAYVAANCHTVLAKRPEVDPAKICIVGHSYGGKWAMFASCLYEKFACAAWSDPGIVFDEERSNVNYWEPWYLGYEPGQKRKPGMISESSPRTGAYNIMMERGRDLHELHALMVPRPFLVSGGSEDGPERWRALNQSIEVNNLLGSKNRVAMTNRPAHTPTAESNEQMYRFFEYFLK